MTLHLNTGAPAPKLDTSLKNLSSQATALNEATKRLTKTILDLDMGLKKLNLGVSSWVLVSTKEDDSSAEWLGYAKVNGKWGLAIREITLGHDGDAEDFKDCLFCDAAREVRIRAIEHMPKLFDKLSKDAEAITTKLTKNIENAEVLAKLIGGREHNSFSYALLVEEPK